MKTKTIFLILTMLIHFNTLLAINPVAESNKKYEKILILTVPKSGTHLLKKTIEKITDIKLEWIPLKENLKFNPRPFFTKKQIGLQHVLPHFDIFKGDQTGKILKIVLVRDPRDVIVSEIFWLANAKDWVWWTPPHAIDSFNQLSWDEKINNISNFPGNHLTIKSFYSRALSWMQEPDVLICRYEDLVGDRGGGDAAIQHETIRAIASKMGYVLSDKEIQEIADSIYGSSMTFREGKVGSWQGHLSQDNLQTILNDFGNEMQILGYY